MKHRLMLCCLSTTLLVATSVADETTLKLAKLEPDSRSSHSTTTDSWSVLNPKKLSLRSAAALIVCSVKFWLPSFSYQAILSS